MKKIVALFILCYLWLPSLGQRPPEIRRNKLIFLTTVTTPSGVNKGYLWQLSDSTIALSPTRKLNGARQPFQLNVIPERTILDFSIKRKRMPSYYPIGGAVSGFLITGLLILKAELDNPDPPSRANRTINKLLLGAGTGLGFVAGISITFKKRKFNFKNTLPTGLRAVKEPVEKFIKGQVDLPVQASFQ